MALLVELATFLAAQGSLALTRGTNLFDGKLPDTPDDCVAIYQYAGLPAQHVLGSGRTPAYERPRVQVVCRSAAYTTAVTKAEAVKGVLDKLPTQTLSSVRYLSILATGEPFPLPRDTNDRALIACNYQIWKERS